MVRTIDRDAEAEDGEGALERLEPWRIAQGGVEQERPQHDEKTERQQPERGHQHIGNGFEPEQNPIPRLQHAIGPVEADPQALDSARGKIDGESGAERERAGMSGGEHVLDFPGDRAGDLVGPGREHELGHLVGKVAGAEEAGERCEHDEERKHRHQGGERDVACDGPAVVRKKTPIGIKGDVEGASHREVRTCPHNFAFGRVHFPPTLTRCREQRPEPGAPVPRLGAISAAARAMRRVCFRCNARDDRSGSRPRVPRRRSCLLGLTLRRRCQIDRQRDL